MCVIDHTASRTCASSSGSHHSQDPGSAPSMRIGSHHGDHRSSCCATIISGSVYITLLARRRLACRSADKWSYESPAIDDEELLPFPLPAEALLAAAAAAAFRRRAGHVVDTNAAPHAKYIT